jgi:regulation of enolase protein 1 (concanavalin A-like superfamily)
MATYYVSTTGNDSNIGSLASPWRTFQKAINSCVAGDTAYFRGGVYNEMVTTWISGTASNRITFIAYPGEIPILDGTGLTPTAYQNQIYVGGSYVTVDGFECRNFNLTTHNYGYGVWVDPNSNYVIIRNHISHDMWSAGIICGGNNATVENSVVYNTCLGVRSDVLWPGVEMWGSGLQVQTPNYSPWTGAYTTYIRQGSVCRNNIVYENYGEGIMLMRVKNCECYGNIVYDNMAVNLYVTDCDHCNTYGNLVYATSRSSTLFGTRGPGRGLGTGNEYAWNSAGSSYNNFYNNIVYKTAAPFTYFIQPTSGGFNQFLNCNVVNNIFADGDQVGAGPYGNSATTVQFSASAASGSTFMNNICTQTNVSYAIFSGNTSGITFSYNLWSKTPSGLALVNSIVSSATLFTNTGTYGSGTLTGHYFDPVSTSPAIGQATTLALVSTDFFGNTRLIPPTIGAIEYNSSGGGGGSNTSITWGDIPTPWYYSDIGTVGVVGNAQYSNGMFKVVSSGSDIYFSSDSFGFLSQVLRDDFEISLSVDSFDSITQYSKYGLMIRDSLDANSVFYMINKEPSDNPTTWTRSYKRIAQAGSAQSLTIEYTTDKYLKLKRVANTIYGYASANGVTWTEKSNTSLPLSNNAYVGLAACSQLNTTLGTAIFNNVVITQRIPSPWEVQDIGPIDVAGSDSFTTPNQFTLVGNGVDIWGNADTFRFCSVNLTGNFEMYVNFVSSSGSTSIYSKNGIMARNSTSSNSQYILISKTPINNNRIETTYRSTLNGTAQQSAEVYSSANTYLKITRIGNNFKTFRSNSNSNWLEMANTTIVMDDTIKVGMVACDNTYSSSPYNKYEMITSTFNNVYYSAGTPSTSSKKLVLFLGDIF